MMHDESPEELELSKSKVTRLNCTHSFVSIKADTNVGLSDHGHIVSTVTNREGDNVRIIFFNESYYFSLLSWRYPATNNSLTSLANLKEIVLEMWLIKDDL